MLSTFSGAIFLPSYIKNNLNIKLMLLKKLKKKRKQIQYPNRNEGTLYLCSDLGIMFVFFKFICTYGFDSQQTGFLILILRLTPGSLLVCILLCFRGFPEYCGQITVRKT